MRPVSQPGVVTLLAVIAATGLVLFIFQKVIWLVLPALLGLVVYYGVRPIVEALVVRGVPHSTAAKCVWVLLQIIAATAVIAAVLLAAAKAATLQTNLERYLAGGRNLLRQTAEALEKVVPMFQKMSLAKEVDQDAQQFLDQFGKRNLLPVVLLLVKWLPSLLLVPYFTYFMLSDSTRLKKYIIRSVPNAFFEKALLLFSRLDVSLQRYFQGLLLLTLVESISLSLGLGILGMKNAIWLGLTAAVLAWIPYVGSAVGYILVILVAATDFPEKPWVAYGALGVCAAVRCLDDFVFMPLTVGRNLHIHPLLSVLLLFLGAMAAGATGLVLALPMFAVSSVIGETLSQIVSDRKLRARYRAARQLAASSASS